MLNIFGPSINSTIIPERLDAFINRYAEYTHDKWAFEKVGLVFSLRAEQPCIVGLHV